MRFLATLFALAATAFSQGNPSWSRPFPAHRIAGNLYYAGTEDLACFLIATPDGHILINTGLEDSVPLLRDSFKKLGFKLEDVRILLNMQAHYDHVAAMAEVQKISGAKVYATEGDAPILEDGGKSDPHFTSRFPPVKVDRILRDGEIIGLGGAALKVIYTPGHSKGSVSYWMRVDDNGQPRSVAIANMGTVVMPLKGLVKYPRIADDFAASFAKQKALSPDIWVAAHASQYDMQEKLKRGTFVDPRGYIEAVARHEKNFQEELAQSKRR